MKGLDCREPSEESRIHRKLCNVWLSISGLREFKFSVACGGSVSGNLPAALALENTSGVLADRTVGNVTIQTIGGRLEELSGECL